jgi:hypothetical protein
MQQRRPEQPFRRDRFPARILVELGKLAIEARQHLVHDLRDEAQRLPRRDARLNVDNENSNPEVLSDPRAGPLLCRPARNHIRSTLSASVKFNNLLS